MNRNLSIVSIDFGEKYMGLASSRRGSFLATPLPAIIRTSIEEDLKKVCEVIKAMEAELLLIGMPYALESKIKTDQCLKIEDFSERLRDLEPTLKIIYVDERLSSWSTKKQMGKKRLKRGAHKANLDSLVAVSFIENYLEA